MKSWITRAGILAAAFAWALPAQAADHKDSPSVSTDATTDITDLYAFVDGTNLVVIMDVNPLSGPVATEDIRFNTNALYKFHIDADGNVSADAKTYTIQFADKGTAQWIRVRGTGHGSGATDDIVGQINTSADASSPRTVKSSDGAVSVFAGPRDDPFFFSLFGGSTTNPEFKGFESCEGADRCFLGLCNRANPSIGCLQAPNFATYPADSTDTFAGANVSSIVISVPLADFTTANLGVWAATYGPNVP
jgi:hypothetical protein